MHLYLLKICQYASQEQLDEIRAELLPPPHWINPQTGVPAGFTTDDVAIDDWV